MTVTEVTPISGPYNGNGALDEFDYDFYIADESELVVTLADVDGAETVQTITTHYTVDRDSETGKGTFTMLTAPATGEKVSATVEVAASQTTNLRNLGPFFAETHEAISDKITRGWQQLKEELGRCVKVGPTSGTDPDDVVTGNIVTTSMLDLRAPVLLAEVVASDQATVDLESDDFASYDSLKIELVDVVPAAAAVVLWGRAKDSSGYRAAGEYESSGVSDNSGGSHPAQLMNNTGQNQIVMSTSDLAGFLAATEKLNGNLIISSAATGPLVGTYENCYFKSTPVVTTNRGAFACSSVDAYEGFRIMFDTGNVASGTIRLWGLPTGS